jgi:hypothetical protein
METNVDQPTDKTALSYWYPKLAAAKILVPNTTFIDMPRAAQECMWKAFDGEDGSEEQQAAYSAFCDQIAAAGGAMGWPCFLRTDHTSGKHSWKNTCYLTSPAVVKQHVFKSHRIL